jgi:hypothetical protein
MLPVTRSRGRAAVLTVAFVLFAIGTPSSRAAEPKKILLVHSYGREPAPFDAFVTSFRTEMLDAIEAVLEDKPYVSPCIHAPAKAKP